MRHLGIDKEKTMVIRDGVYCYLKPKNSFIGKVYDFEWSTSDEGGNVINDYEPTLEDWVSLLGLCIDEKYDIIHEMNDFVGGLSDFLNFGGISPSILRSVSIDTINFERESYVASIINEYIFDNEDTDEVKRFRETYEKDTVARNGMRKWLETFIQRK